MSGLTEERIAERLQSRLEMLGLSNGCLTVEDAESRYQRKTKSD